MFPNLISPRIQCKWTSERWRIKNWLCASSISILCCAWSMDCGEVSMWQWWFNEYLIRYTFNDHIIYLFCAGMNIGCMEVNTQFRIFWLNGDREIGGCGGVAHIILINAQSEIFDSRPNGIRKCRRNTHSIDGGAPFNCFLLFFFSLVGSWHEAFDFIGRGRWRPCFTAPCSAVV